jgi:hypothetical protein
MNTSEQGEVMDTTDEQNTGTRTPMIKIDEEADVLQITLSQEDILPKDDDVFNQSCEVTSEELERLKHLKQSEEMEEKISISSSSSANSVETDQNSEQKMGKAERKRLKRLKRQEMKKMQSANLKSNVVDSMEVDSEADPKSSALPEETGPETGFNPNLGEAQSSKPPEPKAFNVAGKGKRGEQRNSKPLKAKSGEGSGEKVNSKPPNVKSGGGSGEKGGGGNKGKKDGQKRKLHSPNANVPPGKKASKTGEYAGVAKLDLTVLIRRVGKSFETSEYLALRAKLCDRIDSVPAGPDKPLFESNSLKNGAYTLRCANVKSRDWLLQQVREVALELPNLNLWVTTAEKESLRVKIVLTLQDSNSAPTELIFKRLRDSNPGLSTDEWVYVKNLSVRPIGRTMMIHVDRESAIFVLEHGRKLYYLMQRIYVNISKVSELEKVTRPLGSTSK